MTPKLVEIKDLEFAIEYIFSHSVPWHQERQITLQQDYKKDKYDICKHFVLSKVSFN